MSIVRPAKMSNQIVATVISVDNNGMIYRVSNGLQIIPSVAVNDGTV